MPQHVNNDTTSSSPLITAYISPINRHRELELSMTDSAWPLFNAELAAPPHSARHLCRPGTQRQMRSNVFDRLVSHYHSEYFSAWQATIRFSLALSHPHHGLRCTCADPYALRHDRHNSRRCANPLPGLSGGAASLSLSLSGHWPPHDQSSEDHHSAWSGT